MEIKTIDDLIEHLEVKAGINRDSSIWVGRYVSEAFQYCLDLAKELKVNMEAKQSKDREFLTELSFPDMSQQSIEWAHGLKHDEELGAITNFVSGRENGLVNMIIQIRKHLEDNP